MSYLTNFDTLLSSMTNDGQTTQSPEDLYRIYHGMFMDVSAVLPTSNEGADNSAATIWLQPAHSTGNPQRTYPCPLGAGCAVPLEGTTTSVYRHLRRHGLIHSHRGRAPCPWPGCRRDICWGNVARHIVERHLKVKLRCTVCGKLYTRNDSLNAHMRVCVARTFGV